MKRNAILIILMIFLCSFQVNGEEEKKNIKLFFSEVISHGHIDTHGGYYVYDIMTGNKERRFDKKQLPAYGPPCISEDGNYFAYYYEEEKNKYIRVVDIQKNVLILSKEVPFDGIRQMDFRKDLIAVCGKTGRYYYNIELFLINVNTKELERITNNDLVDYDPVISPAGDSILFLQINSELTETYLQEYSLTTNETKTVHVFEDTGYELYQWLEEDKILLTRKEKSGIPFIMDLKTKKITDFDLDRIAYIQVSPDGEKLVYLRMVYYDDPFMELYISDFDGSNEKKIEVDDRVDVIEPQWFME